MKYFYLDKKCLIILQIVKDFISLLLDIIYDKIIQDKNKGIEEKFNKLKVIIFFKPE